MVAAPRKMAGRGMMWFDSWSQVSRVLLVGVGSYFALVLVLRVAGKRTLSQFNAFDFVVTVALGSTLATILLSSDVAWFEGVAAFVILALLQFLIALLTSRWKFLSRVVTSKPVLLLYHGTVDTAALRANRISKSQLLAAIRGSGSGDTASIAAVVLESNGTMSVIPSTRLGDGSALEDFDIER
jgi:uncharacterized membrane protein YcaP (DUF421 family)